MLEGLEGALAAAGSGFDRQRMDAMLSQLGNRVFLLHDVHENEPVVFQSRWALSYLRGPLTCDQISVLMQPRKQIVESPAERPTAASATPPSVAGPAVEPADGERPVLPPDIEELFWAYRGTTPSGHRLLYQPSLLGRARLHFAESKSRVDVWQDVLLLATAIEASADDPWDESEVLEAEEPDLESTPAEARSSHRFPRRSPRAKTTRPGQPPSRTTCTARRRFRCSDRSPSRPPRNQARASAIFVCGCLTRCAKTATPPSMRCGISTPKSSLRSEKRSGRPRSASSERRPRQANRRFKRRSPLAARFWGRWSAKRPFRPPTWGVPRLPPAQAGRAMQQRGDIALAAEDVEKYQKMYSDLEAKLQSEIDDLQAAGPDAIPLEPLEVKPKKSEIAVERVALAWMPWWSGGGSLTKAF